MICVRIPIYIALTYCTCVRISQPLKEVEEQKEQAIVIPQKVRMDVDVKKIKLTPPMVAYIEANGDNVELGGFKKSKFGDKSEVTNKGNDAVEAPDMRFMGGWYSANTGRYTICQAIIAGQQTVPAMVKPH